jgi:hypothetical protein
LGIVFRTKRLQPVLQREADRHRINQWVDASHAVSAPASES